MKYCSQCGFPVEDQDKFCPRCGHRFPEGKNTTLPAQDQETDSLLSEKRKNHDQPLSDSQSRATDDSKENSAAKSVQEDESSGRQERKERQKKKSDAKIRKEKRKHRWIPAVLIMLCILAAVGVVYWKRPVWAENIAEHIESEADKIPFLSGLRTDRTESSSAASTGNPESVASLGVSENSGENSSRSQTDDNSPEVNSEDESASSSSAAGQAASDNSSAPDGNEGAKGDTWAVYVYMCGTNLESDTDEGLASTEIQSMLASNNSSEVEVILETGGATAWHNDRIPADQIGRFLIQNGNLQELELVPQENMGSAETLTEFLTFCRQYPADHEMLIFWDHGGGTLFGCCNDYNFEQDGLEIAEINQALNDAGYQGQLDIIGFDACLMATLDVANMASDYAHYLVASEEIEVGPSWDYEKVLKDLSNNPQMSPLDAAKSIVDSYYKAEVKAGYDDKVTMSVTDLTELEDLNGAFDVMGAELLSYVQNGYLDVFSRFFSDIGNAENYGGNNVVSSYFDMVDLGNAVEECAECIPESKDLILSALDKAVVYNQTGDLRKRSHGLAFYYPLDVNSTYLYYYYKMNGPTSYVMYLSVFMNRGLAALNEELNDPDLASLIEATNIVEVPQIEEKLEAYIDPDTGFIKVPVNDQTHSAVSSALSDLWLLNANGVAVSLGQDRNYQFKDGSYQDNFYNLLPFLDNQVLPLFTAYITDEINLYLTPVLYNGQEATLESVYDKSANAYGIVDVVIASDEDSEMASKMAYYPQAGDVINILYQGSNYKKLIAGDGEYEVAKGPDIIWTDSMRIIERDAGDQDYLYCFELVDLEGTSHLSQFVRLRASGGEIQGQVLK